MSQGSRGRRRGNVFPLRLTADERAQLEARMRAGGGPRALGPWLVWRALHVEVLPRRGEDLVLPGLVVDPPGRALPAQRAGEVLPGRSRRVILDLCGGSGSWSQPYADAGYTVIVVTLPEQDVRTYVPPADVWGVLAAPPCDQFSLARNGCSSPRDLARAMDVVNACMRIVVQVRPRWWALENPVGLLGHYLGTPRDVWQPCDFGDPWTKRTAIWGDFAFPKRGPFVEPTGSAMDRPSAAERAITPPGFARAFYEANP